MQVTVICEGVKNSSNCLKYKNIYKYNIQHLTHGQVQELGGVGGGRGNRLLPSSHQK